MSICLVQRMVLLGLCSIAALQTPTDSRDRAKAKQPAQNSTCNDVPAHPVEVVAECIRPA